MAKGFQFFGFEAPDSVESKASVKLAKTDFIRADIQWVGPGGANNLHTHTGNDGFWLVLSGRARFYGEAAEPAAELGPMQGALVPHGTAYWFESAGDEPLEILHVAARTLAKVDKRVDLEARRRPAHEGGTATSITP